MLLDEKKPDDFDFEDDLDDLDDFDYQETIQSVSDNAPVHKEPEEERTILQELWSYVKILAAAVVIALIINNFIIINATIPTGSMIHTIMKNDRLIGFRLAYIFSAPKRGDIIIFKFPDDTSQKFVKRVIGLPGDVVEIKQETDGVHVYVNGTLLNEPYLHEAMRINKDYTYIVPSDSYFVMGDNRNDSKDSRYWQNTYVPKNYILAKAVFKYYSEFEIFKRPAY